MAAALVHAALTPNTGKGCWLASGKRPPHTLPERSILWQHTLQDSSIFADVLIAWSDVRPNKGAPWGITIHTLYCDSCSFLSNSCSRRVTVVYFTAHMCGLRIIFPCRLASGKICVRFLLKFRDWIIQTYFSYLAKRNYISLYSRS